MDALRRCVGDVERFRERSWGQEVLMREPSTNGFDDLLSLDDVDLLLSEYGLRAPAFRLVRDGQTLPSSGYTRSARIGGQSMSGIADPARVFAAFDQGATIVLQGLQRYWPPLARFCRDLELDLGHRCQVNAYVTPPGSQGFRPHSDTHDAFILQAFGHKEWRIWAAPGEVDGRDEVHDEDEEDAENADEDSNAATAVQLRPGTAVYMPTGTRHAARTGQSVSGHLTVGIHPTRWRDVLRETVDALLDDETGDAPLPVGYHRNPDAVAARLRGHAEEVAARLGKLDAHLVANDLAERFLTARPSALRGGLADRLRLADLHDGTPLRRRPESVCEIRGSREGLLRVLLGDRELRVPSWVEPAVRYLAAQRSLAPQDLAPHLDPASRHVLVRRLVREGLLEVADG